MPKKYSAAAQEKLHQAMESQKKVTLESANQQEGYQSQTGYCNRSLGSAGGWRSST